MSTPSLMLLSIIIETPSKVWEKFMTITAEENVFSVFLASCFSAFLVNAAQFLVTSQIGALPMQVLGNAKTVFVSVASIAIFRNSVSAQGAAGYITIIAGVFLFDIAKQKKAEKLPSTTSLNDRTGHKAKFSEEKELQTTVATS